MSSKIRKVTVIFCVAFISMSISCRKYLDLSPISDYNSGSFFATNQGFNLAINGLYSIFQNLYSAQLIPAILEGRSDNIGAIDPLETNHGYMQCSSFVDNSGTPELTSIWKGFWRMIILSNKVINNIDKKYNNTSNQAEKDWLKGQAYFFRGYAYFNLGWMFGGVPLIDHEVTSEVLLKIPRSKQSETFTFAANDLIKAAELLPKVWSADDMGRTTKYAAEGILAKLYLFNSNYSKAKPLLEDIINSGNYKMAPTYKQCFIDQYDNSPEQILQVQFIAKVGQGTDYPSFCMPQTLKSDQFPNGGYLGMQISEDLYKSYDKGDKRRDFNILKGWYNKAGDFNDTRLFYKKFSHGTVPSDNRNWPVNLPILRYTDVLMMYAEILNNENYVPDGKAFEILNKIRTRAGLPSLTSTQIPTQEAFRNALLRERRWEFAGEYLRWFTLLRTNNAMKTINVFLNKPAQGSGKFQMKKYQRLFAIPQYELDINPNTKYMPQNQGY